MEVTDDEVGIHLLIGIKYKVIVADTGSPILNIPHSTSLVFCETKVPIQDRGGHTPLYLTRQGIFMYINLFYTAGLTAGMKSNPAHKSFGNISTKIIRVMWNIGLTTSLYRTTSTPENCGSTIDQHDIPTIWSWVSNSLFISIVRTHMIRTINKTYLVWTRPKFMETLNITNYGPANWNGGFGMISSLMDSIYTILNNMIQILLGMILSLGLLH